MKKATEIAKKKESCHPLSLSKLPSLVPNTYSLIEGIRISEIEQETI
jgi:hypothetical protein